MRARSTSSLLGRLFRDVGDGIQHGLARLFHRILLVQDRAENHRARVVQLLGEARASRPLSCYPPGPCTGGRRGCRSASRSSTSIAAKSGSDPAGNVVYGQQGLDIADAAQRDLAFAILHRLDRVGDFELAGRRWNRAEILDRSAAAASLLRSFRKRSVPRRPAGSTSCRKPAAGRWARFRYRIGSRSTERP